MSASLNNVSKIYRKLGKLFAGTGLCNTGSFVLIMNKIGLSDYSIRFTISQCFLAIFRITSNCRTMQNSNKFPYTECFCWISVFVEMKIKRRISPKLIIKCETMTQRNKNPKRTSFSLSATLIHCIHDLYGKLTLCMWSWKKKQYYYNNKHAISTIFFN